VPLSRRDVILGCGSVLSVPLLAQAPQGAMAQQEKPIPKDWAFAPTPPAVVEKMLELAQVTRDDLVLDLGSGDGRIPIAAARIHGARGRGVDINRVRVEEARKNASEAGVEHLVTFVHGDAFEAPITDATLIALYMFQHLMERLAVRFRRELKPGTRIVSHLFTLGDDWRPDRTEKVGLVPVHLWIV
jgi:cyclopropane fatty-acyl-phospholipid synthase-like methyltransferase